MKARVTMRDVAQLAQVSLGTTSQALSNRPNVAPETRMRVLEAAAALGYQRQVRLDTPVTTKLTTVGMLTKLEAGESLAINPFYSHVLAGVERECQRQGMSLMYANIEVDEHSCALNWPPMLDEQRVDGILVVGTFLEDTILQISRQASQPIVLVDAYASGQPVDSILTDNVNGAYSAVKYGRLSKLA
jgi:DNA-binding LacI/PurR family transcriptional regulator